MMLMTSMKAAAEKSIKIRIRKMKMTNEGLRWVGGESLSLDKVYTQAVYFYGACVNNNEIIYISFDKVYTGCVLL